MKKTKLSIFAGLTFLFFLGMTNLFIRKNVKSKKMKKPFKKFLLILVPLLILITIFSCQFSDNSVEGKNTIDAQSDKLKAKFSEETRDKTHLKYEAKSAATKKKVTEHEYWWECDSYGYCWDSDGNTWRYDANYDPSLGYWWDCDNYGNCWDSNGSSWYDYR